MYRLASALLLALCVAFPAFGGTRYADDYKVGDGSASTTATVCHYTGAADESCLIFTGTSETVELESYATGAVSAFLLDAQDASHSGDILEVQDDGTWKFRVNSSGHVQMASGSRLYATLGLDESTYPRYMNAFQHYIYPTTAGIHAELWLKGIDTGSTTSHAMYGLYLEAYGQSATNNAVWSDLYGGQFSAYLYENGGATGQTVGSIVGGHFQSGSVKTTAATVTNVYGGRFKTLNTGTNQTISNAYGAAIVSPSTPGSGTTIANAYGLSISNQGGHGTSVNEAIYISTQTSGSALRSSSATYNAGYLQLGNVRLWEDGTALRAKDGTPSSASDGVDLLAHEYGGMSVNGNSTATTISSSSTWYQITSFDTDDGENGADADNTNDHITVSAGTYLVTASIAFSGATSGDTIEIQVQKNNGATGLSQLHLERKIGTGGDVGSGSISGIATFSANDTVELWVQNLTSAGNVTIRDANLAVVRLK